VFHPDVAKVDISYVVIVIHVCCELLFSMFHLFSRRMLQVWLSRCCIYFHTYIASVLSGCYVCML
jgi:hypothetical protein